MAGFDAERYLRFAAERALLAAPDPRHSHEVSPVTVAAQALVAIGVIDDATAAAVLADYVLADALRGDVMSLHSLADDGDEPDRADAVEPLTSARVVSCDAEMELASGRLHVSHVTLGTETTTIAGVLRLGAAPSRRRRAMPMGGGPPTVTVTDDRGTRTQAQFSGGGSDAQREGHFYATPGLHLDTAFLEIDGHRIDLVDRINPAEFWIEDLPEQDPALRFLWQCATPEGHMRERTLVEPAIAAFVAADAIASDDPQLAHIRLVAETFQHGPMYRAPSPRAKQLPEPWRSLIVPSRRRGPVGTLAVSAATPVFDGFAVAVSAVQSDEDGWTAEVEVAPELEMFSPFDGPRVRPRRLTWWAADDRGNQYLGGIGEWSGGEESAHGSIHFSGALDLKAAYIDLLPTALTQRAVIRVPLEWS